MWERMPPVERKRRRGLYNMQVSGPPGRSDFTGLAGGWASEALFFGGCFCIVPGDSPEQPGLSLKVRDPGLITCSTVSPGSPSERP